MKLGKGILVVALIGGVALMCKAGYDYYNSNQNNARKTSGIGDVDTTGMSDYTITIPFKYQQKLFINGDFSEAIKSIGYSFISENVINDTQKNHHI